jgi:putative ABC transport system permease protein
MRLWRIAWRSIQQRGVASVLTMISMALGVMLVTAVLLIMGVISESFRSNASLGYNLIVGAQGGDLQLVLNSVFYLSTPVENLPYEYYQEFATKDIRGDGVDGKYSELVNFAIPICMGDYYKGFRVVGTTPEMFDDYVFDREKNRKYEFREGRNFKNWSPEYGFFEAVLGSKLASDCNLKVGDAFAPTHGSDGDEHDAFYVVGILDSSGTPNDRAAFVNLEGFLLLDGHAKDADTENPKCSLCGQDLVDTKIVSSNTAIPASSMFDVEIPFPENLDEVSKLDEARRRLEPLPTNQREVTSILLRTVSGIVTPGLTNKINEGQKARAVSPISEIYLLFNKFVNPIKWVLLGITTLICVVSGVSIVVSIYNSMNDRKHEIAVMRALGAGRRKILMIVLAESIMLSLLGGLLGWIVGHVLIGGVASPLIEDRTGVTIGLFDLAPRVNPFEFLGESPIMEWKGISSELLLIPALILLAIVVGFMPALTAYRTDVAKALSANP